MNLQYWKKSILIKFYLLKWKKIIFFLNRLKKIFFQTSTVSKVTCIPSIFLFNRENLLRWCHFYSFLRIDGITFLIDITIWIIAKAKSSRKDNMEMDLRFSRLFLNVYRFEREWKIEIFSRILWSTRVIWNDGNLFPILYSSLVREKLDILLFCAIL